MDYTTKLETSSHIRAMVGADVTAPLSGTQKMYNSKSTPTSPTIPRYYYGDVQQRQSSESRNRATLMSCHHRPSPVSGRRLYSGNNMSGRSPCATENMTSCRRTLQDSQFAKREPCQSGNLKGGGQSFEVSHFSRSRSRIFYASDDLWNEDEVPPSPGGHIIRDENHFERTCHRGSSGRKSYDSGFSDSADGTLGSGQTPTSKVPSSNQGRKAPKWSSAFPIKAFLRSHEFSEGHLPKLSMLGCCIGIEPGSYFLSKQKRFATAVAIDSTTTNGHQSPANKIEVAAGSELSLKDEPEAKELNGTPKPSVPSRDGMGTWPRIRKSKDCSATLPFTVPPKATYQSTRLHKLHKSQEQGLREGNKLLRRPDLKQPILNERVTAFILNPSLQQWSKDLQFSTEDECMNTLQSKTVVRNVADVISMANKNAKDMLMTLHAKHDTLAVDLMKLKRKIDNKDLQKAQHVCNRITSNVENFLGTCAIQQENTVTMQQSHRLVAAHCRALNQFMERTEKGDMQKEDWFSLRDIICALASALNSLTEALTEFHIKNIVDVLEEPPNLFSLSTAMNTIETLSIQDSRFCRHIALAGGIHSLFTICIDPRYKPIRPRVLRSLATLCCVWESVREMEECGGIECITDILTESTSSEEEKREAAGFIAQITSPSLENSHQVRGLAENIPSLIRSLTDIARTTRSGDSFLLATAALGNLTFLTNHACLHLRKCHTVEMLVSTCHAMDKKADSVFVKDQVATILTNMSNFPEGKTDVLDSGGLLVLLCLLQIRPCLAHNEAEIAACERVQQKSAIALSRLCSEEGVPEKIIELQGVQRLIRLCKDAKERNQSDAILVACLAVLRKIATACGFDEFKDLDAMELVKPRLLDTFLIYSSRQESYV